MLFFLPGRVNELKDDILDVGKFSQVVSDVDKVRSLFRDTKVPAFQKVMKELHESVASLQTHLQEKLFESSVQNQTQIVRQLIELGATGDPTWDALQTSLRVSVLSVTETQFSEIYHTYQEDFPYKENVTWTRNKQARESTMRVNFS